MKKGTYVTPATRIVRLRERTALLQPSGTAGLSVTYQEEDI